MLRHLSRNLSRLFVHFYLFCVKLEKVRNDFGFRRIRLETVRGKYGTVVGGVGLAEFYRHCERVVKIGEGTVGIKSARVKDRLHGGGDL